MRAKKHLTKNQLYALDVLDAILESSATQYRCNMQRGDILFNLDSEDTAELSNLTPKELKDFLDWSEDKI